jgi:hypothetical protein
MRYLLLLGLLGVLFAAPVQAAPPVIGGCEILPADNAWNTDISDAPVHPLSNTYISTINANGGDFVHPDFGEDPTYGIPWTTVDGTQPLVPVTFEYDHDSDPGPYPIPPDAPVESGGDRHVLVVETTNCILYEMYASEYVGGAENAWTAGSGAVFDLGSNALRPDGWTSADAAGLPILPGLAKCEEAMSGEITHALRFTVSRTQKAYVYPATHYASSYTDPAYPPMGLRFRLKANYDLSGLTGQALAIAQALKKYGMIVADNGSNWYISGETNPTCWNDDELNQLKAIPGTAFEVIVSPPPPSTNAAELLANGGFEGADGRQALAWKAKNVSGEKRVCDEISAIDGIYKKVSFEGYCAYKFKGGAGEQSKIQQKIEGLLAGDALLLSAQATGKNVETGMGRVEIKVKYSDDTKDKYTLTFEGGSYEYTPFTTTSTLDALAVAKAKITVLYPASGGKLTIDNLSLVKVTATLLPLP